MRKVLTFLSALGFLSTSTLSVVACGVGPGATVETKKDAPTEAKKDQDPISDYVYNDSYKYDNYATSLVMGISGQLAVDKIKDHKQENADSPIWQKFYNSHSWTDGSFSTIVLNNFDQPSPTTHDFSYSAKNDENLFVPQFKDNDASKDTNRVRVYWFVTSPNPWSKDSSDFKPSKETIKVPSLSEFNDKTKKISLDGYLHLYLLISGFKIDFSAKISFAFKKTTDKNGLSLVTLDADTWNLPYGSKIDPENPSSVYNTRIANVVIEEKN